MLLDQIQKKSQFDNLYARLTKPGQIIHGLTNSAKSFILAHALDRSPKPIIFVVQNHYEAQVYYREIKNLSMRPVFNFLCQEVSPYDQINSDINVLSNQYHIFDQWRSGEVSLAVINFKAFLQLYINKNLLRNTEERLTISKSYTDSPLNLARNLVELGYTKESMVETRGQFSNRGDIFDIYPLVGDPVRIEFFDNVIENIRTFSTVTQRSIQQIQSFVIHPRYSVQRSQSDNLREKIKSLVDKHSSSLMNEARESLNVFLDSILSSGDIDENLYWEGVEYYRGLLDQEPNTLFDYLPDNCQIIFDEWQDLINAAEKWEQQVTNQYEEGLTGGRLVPVLQPLHYSCIQTTEKFKNYTYKSYLQMIAEDNDLSFEVLSYPSERFANKVEAFVDFIKVNLRNQQQIVIFSEQPQRVLGILKEWDISGSYLDMRHLDTDNLMNFEASHTTVLIQRDGLEEGVKLPDFNLIILTDKELFGRSRQAVARQKTADREMLVKNPIDIYTDISELKVGDFVVHYKHGIGIYKGTEFIELGSDRSQSVTYGSIKQEYLAIEYADEARILIPTDQVNLLSRFRVIGEIQPKVSKLGSLEWERTKKKVKKSVRKIAHDLINLYAMRQKQQGYKYPSDTPWQTEMEDAFPYTETEDQLKTIVDVKQDMESIKLMDRLICGDAGFGKTEVIIRAAFKVVMEGRQVAILVPTTVLAQQHFDVFKDRYAPYPVRIGLLSRFRTSREQKEVMEKLKIGDCDVVVGTHRLLQKDIKFKNLGMLVIDEEQRFGVSHKEKLKELRKDLDIITMSATPIPRTLHMSLSGIKDISLIATPPTNRLPVKTYVGEYKNTIIRNAILHELERGGQVFFVHNRIETITGVAARIQELVPEATVRIAHGQMHGRELEDQMFAFVNNEFQVLVCTTIIETGLDIANANTIIIDNANTFGLSQLYQLRGRVGRSDVQAYAYLLYYPDHDISDTARYRLKAIRELTNLGSGYQIALRDMEIRGVGNVFGAEQHGHMLAVGFDLYCKILSETVEEMKSLVDFDSDIQIQAYAGDLDSGCTVDIKISAFFPEIWIDDQKQRINEYKRLAEIRDERSIDALVNEWGDRFGKLPLEAKNLVEIARVKILAKKAGIISINQEREGIKIYTNLRLQAWIPLQKTLPAYLQSKVTFKPGTPGSRHSQSYVLLKSPAAGFGSDILLDTVKELISKLRP